MELVCTENNSVTYNPGKQTTSLVNALFYCDTIGCILKTEFNALVWWNIRNAQQGEFNNSASLYGWRSYGDYGAISPYNERYPTFYAMKLMQYFARGGDTAVSASTDYWPLCVYATRRTDGSLALLVVNKSPSDTLTAELQINGFVPGSTATVYSYGIPQDTAARTGVGSKDITQSTLTNTGSTFTAIFAPYSATVLRLTPGGGSVSGTINLQGAISQAQSVKFSFRPTNGTSAFDRNVTPGGTGAFTLTDIPSGSYQVAVKGAKWLRKTLSLTVNGAVGSFNVTLTAGDANNDNSVDVLDLDLLIGAFDSVVGDALWNPNADLNCDGSVDVLDLDLFIQNFDRSGDN